LAAYATLHKDALDDAQYWMARCLLRTHHRRFAKRFLMHCVRRRYKVARSLALLAVADFI
jgi:hypothetical protein